MKLAVIVCFIVAGVAASPPQYSTRYATVNYQGRVDKPETEYGPPPQEAPTSTESSTESEAEQIKDDENDAVNDKLSEGSEVEGLQEEAVYYIYHPEGLLQRVVYLAKDDPQNMEYTAQFRYEDVEPIKEPIYTYDPVTFVWQQLQFY